MHFAALEILDSMGINEKDGIVYFANPADNYCLYSMNPDGTNIKKLEDQSVSYINVDDHYIYYCKLKGKSAGRCKRRIAK